MKKITLIVAASVCVMLPVHAKKTHSRRSEVNTPEQELAGFEVPEGFVVELVASERDGVVNPIDISFDDAGRIWTQTASMYPLDPVVDIGWNELLRLMDNPEAQEKNREFKRIRDLYKGKTKGDDSILVLSGIYPGQKVRTTKFATGLSIPQSVLPYRNGVFVAQGSELFYLKDTNKDGRSDKRIPFLTGFGFTDTHTMAHCLVRGPGGWVHFSQGALNKGNITAVRSGVSTRIDYSKNAKFSLNGKKVEVINAGLNNIWGYTIQANGQWYGTEANDMGASVIPMEEQTGYKGIGNERLRSYQPRLAYPHKDLNKGGFRVGGTGISGLAFSEDGSAGFPAQWKDVAFLANPITSEINCVRINRKPNGTLDAELLPPLLKSKDDWFRPVHLEFGPDGCLYVVDWYNKIVSHNELPTTHPDRDKKHGRIWRIRHESQSVRKIPNLIRADASELVKHLSSPVLWEKRAAWHQIADRPSSETEGLIPSLLKLVAAKEAAVTTRILALWSIESLGYFDEKLMTELLDSKEGELRREAVRSLAGFDLAPEKVASLLRVLAVDENVMVRSQVLRTLADIGSASSGTIDLLVSACKKEIDGDGLGGAYERKFERYLARKALEQYPTELKSYLMTPAGLRQPAANLLWATQALPDGGKSAFLAIWNELKSKPMTDSTFVVVAGLTAQPDILEELRPMFNRVGNAEKYVDLAMNNLADVQSDSFAKVISLSLNILLKTGDAEQQSKALGAVAKLRVKESLPAVRTLFNADSALAKACLIALDVDKESFVELFEGVLNNEKASFDLKQQALFSLNRVKRGSLGLKSAKLLLGEDAGRKLDVINTLARSDHGLYQARELVDAGLLSADDFDYSTADRMHFALKRQNNATVQRIYAGAKSKYDAAIAKARGRIPALVQQAEEGKGVAATGNAVFSGMCLSCHVVGSAGTGIGPALDGSAERDAEALLTALFLPDEAAEGAYVLFRAVEHDGTIHEGLKMKSDAAGVTIAHQGGSETFIPRADIRLEEHAGSRSFMPSGIFDALPDSIIVDIMAHIRTLK